ncbi:hypothetical protein ABLT32_02085 [Bacteroides pyogenes]|uniref:hypothetical protein n=1 Tax=Bacteroides pyogenes TaxID=310300 RepID=UPI004063DD71
METDLLKKIEAVQLTKEDRELLVEELKRIKKCTLFEIDGKMATKEEAIRQCIMNRKCTSKNAEFSMIWQAKFILAQ